MAHSVSQITEEIVGKPTIVDRGSLGVVLPCLLMALAGTYLLYRDINFSATDGMGAPVATLVRREARVRRKGSQSFVWQNVRTDQQIYRKDSIQTGDGSAAVLKLKDGSTLEIGENSLLVLDDSKDLALNFLEGSVVVRGANGDSKLTKDKDGKVNIEKLPTHLLAPESLSNVFVSEKGATPIPFKWDNGASDVKGSRVLQISKDSSFTPGQIKSVVLDPPTRSEAQVALTAGHYYWRIVLEDGLKPLSGA